MTQKNNQEFCRLSSSIFKFYAIVLTVLAVVVPARVMYLQKEIGYNVLVGEYEIPLCDGYKMDRTNGSEVVITNSNHHVLGGNILLYATKCPYVVAQFKPLQAPSSQILETHDTDHSYILINAHTHEVKEGLSLDDWKSVLKISGWSPVLKPPPRAIDLLWSL